MQHAVDEQPLGMVLEVDAIILRTVSMKRPPIARDLAELLTIERFQIAGQELKFRQQLQL